MAYKKRSETLENMLSEVINVRRVVPTEYEIKLKRFYDKHAKNMQRGIFDGVKIPEVKPIIGNLIENLQENQELTNKVQNSAQQYLIAKSINAHTNEELQNLVDTLKKVADIDQIIRSES